MLTRIVHDSFNGASLALNVLIFWLILTKTPSYLRCYSLVLLYLAVVQLTSLVLLYLAVVQLTSLVLLYLAVIQLTAAVSSLLIFKKIMSTPSYYIHSVCGPCRHWQISSLCFRINVVHMAGMAHFDALVAFCYCYRYYVIAYSRAEPLIRNVIISLIVLHLPTIAVYTNFAFSPHMEGVEQERAMNEMIRRDFSVHLAAYWFQCIIFITCFIVAIASIRLNRILASVEHMSASSRRRHSQILKSLLWQAILPSLYGLSAIAYKATMNRIKSGEEIGHIPLVMGSILTALSPIFNIIFTPPYRNALIRSIRSQEEENRPKKSDDSSTILMKPLPPGSSTAV